MHPRIRPSAESVFFALALLFSILECGCSRPIESATTSDALSTTSSATFKTVLKGRYLGAVNDGGAGLVATATVAQAWETFSLEDLNGRALMSGDGVFVRAGHGPYLQAWGGGGSTLGAASNNRLTWETFKIVRAAGAGPVKVGDVIGLQTLNGDWISAQDGGGGVVYAYGPALGPWESFVYGRANENTGLDSGSTNGGGDIVGRISAGYQGWFTAPGDGSNVDPPWWHFTANRQTPTKTNIALRSWPDMSEIATKYGTGFAPLGNGAPSTLFSSYDASTVDTHARWMQEAGVDTIALQRFGDFMDIRDTVAQHVRDAAQNHARKFYVMYDISGWTDFQSALKSDWQDRIVTKLHLTDSPAYARQGGKPVVCIWGLGFLDRPGDAASSLDIVRYFESQGLYVIGGVGPDWRTADGTRWSKVGFGAVYDALDAISPWMVGVIGDAAGSDSLRAERNEGDVAYCHAHGIDYQPCVLPGDLQGHQRKHGDFMWHQFANMIQIGSDALYVSMFDEYNEGNQIAKTAATQSDVPRDSSFTTLDEDGTACTSDYYLRLTGDGGRMLRKEIPFTFVRPTPPK